MLVLWSLLRALEAFVGALRRALSYIRVSWIEDPKPAEVLVGDLDLSKNIWRLYMWLHHNVLLATVHFKLVQILWPHVGVLVKLLLIHLTVRILHHLSVILMLAVTLLHPRLYGLERNLGIEDADAVILSRSMQVHGLRL